MMEPRAYPPDDPRVTIIETPVQVEEETEPGLAPPPRRGKRFGALFLSAISGLAFLALGISVERFIVDLFAREPVLGWVALALALLAAIGALGFVVRELGGLWRLGHVEDLKRRAETVKQTDDARDGREIADALIALYAKRPDTARGRRAVSALRRDVVDGRDRLSIAEREIMVPLDAEARLLIVQAARRVSVVTAVSPRAFIDVLFVIGQSLRLIRRIAEIYGAGTGWFGFWRVARAVIAHLAVTGGMAVGDTLVQQMVGQGLAAKLSARLGEGVINGLMTARVGLAAIDVCRPLPFMAVKPPKLGDLVGPLFSSGAGSSDRS